MAIRSVSPDLTFCFVSGAGSDSSEQGSVMWARVKGKAENAILGMGFKAAYVFRPGFILPMKGVRSKTKLYQFFLDLLGPLLPAIRRLFPNQITTTVNIGRAMIQVVESGSGKRILDPEDMNRLADATPAPPAG